MIHSLIQIEHIHYISYPLIDEVEVRSNVQTYNTAERVFLFLFFISRYDVCVGSPCLQCDSLGVYYRFSPPRVSTSYYYCYADMRIKAYKGSDYTIYIVEAAHTAQYRLVV